MDKGASVIAKLKNKSKAYKKPFMLCLQLFCQEEFLRRISMSNYSQNLILKGGLFIYTLSNFESRSTIDVDFLLKNFPNNFPNNVDKKEKIITEIIKIDSGNDFITFESSGYEKISPHRKYNGVSFKMIGKIKNTRTPFNVDIGVGDIIIPYAESRKIPTQLENFTSPTILTYSLESTISEKFDAIIQRLSLTSRMKDYFDIYYLSNTFDFNGEKLRTAIFETLQNRGTEYRNETFDIIISFSENESMKLKWNNFVKNLDFSHSSFNDVIELLNNFLRPIWNSIISGTDFKKNWSCISKVWIND